MTRRRTLAETFGSLALLVTFGCGQIEVVRDTGGVSDVRLAPKNMGFEAGVAADGVPLEWSETGADARPKLIAIDAVPRGRLRNYSFERDTMIRRSGKASGRLRFDGKTSSMWAAIVQCIDASPEFGGKTARMDGYMKVEGVRRVEPMKDPEGGPPGAKMWLRSDTESEERLDNMDDRPVVGTVAWKRYRVSVPVDPGAIQLCFGLILDGVGTIWVDDLELSVR